MKYTEIIDQLPMMCVPTCLLMILKRRGMDLNLSQEDIASYLDFSNSEETKDLFPNFPVETDKTMQGCKVTNLNNQLFKPLGLPLRENYVSIKSIERQLDYYGGEFDEYIEGVLERDVDVIVSLNHAIVLNRPDKVYRHALILESIDSEGVHLLTPKDNDKTYRETIDVYTFYKAISNIDGGLWIISKI